MYEDWAMRKFKAAIVASALLGLTVALGACASDPVEPDVETSQSPDAGVDAPQAHAAWLDEGRLIGLVTYGSSTCVPVAEVAVAEEDVLTVIFAEEEEGAACTRDMVPRVTLVPVPEDADVLSDLNIVVAETDITAQLSALAEAPASEMTDYEPSAGWYDDQGGFVLLTWGSSTCVPAIESVEATGDADVAVVFAALPADQPCTLDMAPRAMAVQVDGLASQVDVTLLLSGAEITGTTVIMAN
jgi:hypothetical protein